MLFNMFKAEIKHFCHISVFLDMRIVSHLSVFTPMSVFRFEQATVSK